MARSRRDVVESAPAPRPVDPTMERPRDPRTEALLAFVLAVAIVAAYWNAKDCGFIWDDDDYVEENKTLVEPGGLARIWTDMRATPQYYPLVHTTFWIERNFLWGMRPGGFHVVNVLLHLVATLLLWRTLIRLDVQGAWFVAAAFGLHPVHVESVAWVTERKNVLSGVLYFSAAIAYMAATRLGERTDASPKTDWRWWTVGFLCFVGALFSKTVACTLPAALLVVAWWKEPDRWTRHFPLLAGWLIVAVPLALNTARLEREQVRAVGEAFAYGWPERIFLAGRTPWFYASKLLWPSDLAFVYPRWDLATLGSALWLWPLATAALVVGVLLASRKLGRGPAAAILFFGGTLFPALGFFNVYPFKFSFVADHFQYLASVGVLALVVGSAAELARRRGELAKPLTALGGVVLLALGIATFRQVEVYRSRDALWADTVRKNPESALGWSGWAIEAYRTKDYAVAFERQTRALEHAVDDDSRREILTDLGVMRMGAGDRDGAIAALERAATYPDAENASPEFKLGTIAIQEKRWKDAQKWLTVVVNRRSESAEAHKFLAIALASAGDQTSAAPHYREAVRLAPNDLGLKLNYARCLASLKRFVEARSLAEEASRAKESRIAGDARELLRNLPSTR